VGGGGRGGVSGIGIGGDASRRPIKRGRGAGSSGGVDMSGLAVIPAILRNDEGGETKGKGRGGGRGRGRGGEESSVPTNGSANMESGSAASGVSYFSFAVHGGLLTRYAVGIDRASVEKNPRMTGTKMDRDGDLIQEAMPRVSAVEAHPTDRDLVLATVTPKWTQRLSVLDIRVGGASRTSSGAVMHLHWVRSRLHRSLSQASSGHWSPDGHLVTCGSTDPCALVWDIRRPANPLSCGLRAAPLPGLAVPGTSEWDAFSERVSWCPTATMWTQEVPAGGLMDGVPGAFADFLPSGGRVAAGMNMVGAFTTDRRSMVFDLHG